LEKGIEIMLQKEGE